MTSAARLLASALVLASVVPDAARAADVTPETPPGAWRFTLAPYAWAAGLSGDVGLFERNPVEVDVPFSDILENLDVAAMGLAEAHNGTWGVFADLDYVTIGADNSLTRAAGVDPSVSLRVDGSVDVQELMATLMGQWRIVDGSNVTLDLLGGVRYWNVDTDLTFKLAANGTEVKSLSGSDGAEWIDPMIGAKLLIETGTPFYVTGWGMAGGFGVGSDFGWDVMGGLGYEWTEHFSTVLGYRAVGVDYGQDGFVYDVIQSGAVLGAAINF